VSKATQSESKSWPERGAQTDKSKVDPASPVCGVACLAKRRSHKAEVKLACGERVQLLGAGHVEQVQRHAWIKFSESSQRGRQQPVVDVRDVSDVEFGAFSAIHPLHGGDTLGTEREQLFGVEKKSPAFFGERHSVVCSLQQSDADFVLQIPHLPRQRRLGEPELLGGLGKAQFFGNGDEVAEMTKLHFSKVWRPI
jgi:hypothetical protein